MQIEVDGVKVYGTYVAETKKFYAIRGRLYEKARLVKFSTCHREVIIDNPKDKFEYVYWPSAEIEDLGFCPVEIGAFDEKGEHSWAMIDFRREESLSGELGCNGNKSIAKGVSLCQSRKGLIQTIRFDEPVDVEQSELCDEAQTEDHLLWTFVISAEKCLYVFRNTKGDEIHRLLSLGYDNVLMR